MEHNLQTVKVNGRAFIDIGDLMLWLGTTLPEEAIEKLLQLKKRQEAGAGVA